MIEFREWLAVIGASAVMVAVIAWTGDRLRTRRKNLDAVGFMPWTGIFFCALVVACILLGLAAREWLAS